MPKLICDNCGSEQDVPTCCDKSMVARDAVLLCCCTDNCEYKTIPECCGQKMTYVT